MRVCTVGTECVYVDGCVVLCILPWGGGWADGRMNGCVCVRTLNIDGWDGPTNGLLTMLSFAALPISVV